MHNLPQGVDAAVPEVGVEGAPPPGSPAASRVRSEGARGAKVERHVSLKHEMASLHDELEEIADVPDDAEHLHEGLLDELGDELSLARKSRMSRGNVLRASRST